MADKKTEDKFYWVYDVHTFEVNPAPIKAQFRGGFHHIPADALLVEPKEPKDGYVVCVSNFEGQRPTSTSYVEDHRGETFYYKRSATVDDKVREIGPLDEEKYTFKVPQSHFSYWDNEADDWVENTDKKEHFWVVEELESVDVLLELALDGDPRSKNTEQEIRNYRKELRDYTSHDLETDTYTLRGKKRPTL